MLSALFEVVLNRGVVASLSLKRGWVLTERIEVGFDLEIMKGDAVGKRSGGKEEQET